MLLGHKLVLKQTFFSFYRDVLIERLTKEIQQLREEIEQVKLEVLIFFLNHIVFHQFILSDIFSFKILFACLHFC